MSMLSKLGKSAKSVSGLTALLPVPGASAVSAVAGGLGSKLASSSGKKASKVVAGSTTRAVATISPTSQGAVSQWRNGRGYTEHIAGRTLCHVMRKDGSYKTYRPYRSIVLGKRIKVSAVKRAEHRLSTLATALAPYLHHTTRSIHRGRKVRHAS